MENSALSAMTSQGALIKRASRNRVTKRRERGYHMSLSFAAMSIFSTRVSSVFITSVCCVPW